MEKEKREKHAEKTEKWPAGCMRRTIQEGELEFIDRRGILMANLERQVSKKAARTGRTGITALGRTVKKNLPKEHWCLWLFRRGDPQAGSNRH